jgi:NAD-dependent deacetylase
LKKDIIKGFADLLKASKYAVVLTGAGISTESNIPDFRSRITGLWRQRKILKYINYKAMMRDKEGFVNLYKDLYKRYGGAEANKGHRTLAKRESEGIIKCVITQNIDGLHQKGGSKEVLEIHGKGYTAHGTTCNKTYSVERYFKDKGHICDCGGFIRPDVILFGEGLPQREIEGAFEELEKADLIVVLGSSLKVAPAKFLPLYAKARGAKLIIVNKTWTFMNKHFDIKIRKRHIGEVLKEVDELLQVAK